jgi:tetratricopeptide (TPR) repeat protein
MRHSTPSLPDHRAGAARGARFRPARRQGGAGCWLALGLALCASAGAAAEIKPAAAEQRARQEFARAQRAYDLGAYEEAITLYEAAYREFPAPAFLFNIAQAQRLQYRIDGKLEHLRRALALYESYLRQHTVPPNGELVQRLIVELRATLAAEERRTRAAAGTGQLVIQGHLGAELLLDGRPIGRSPLSASVTAGSHRVRAQRSGYRPWEGSVLVAAGARVELVLDLQAAGQPQEAALGAGPHPTASRPFYRRVWFWALTAAVVGAGAGTSAYFALRDPGSSLPQIDLRR